MLLVVYYVVLVECGCVVGNIMSGLVVGILLVWLVFSLVVGVFGWCVMFWVVLVLMVFVVLLIVCFVFLRCLKVMVSYGVLIVLLLCLLCDMFVLCCWVFY